MDNKRESLPKIKDKFLSNNSIIDFEGLGLIKVKSFPEAKKKHEEILDKSCISIKREYTSKFNLLINKIR